MQNQEENNNPEIESADNTAEKEIKQEETANVIENNNDEEKIKELNDKYLRLYSEFDNFRRRTSKERIDLIKTASEDVLKSLLPIIDDFERAIKASENSTDVNAIKEGVNLIYNKLKNSSAQKGLTSFESLNQTFDPDIMEAITHIPATTPEQQGKVVDVVEKGYKLGDKVIRFAKVVIAQ